MLEALEGVLEALDGVLAASWWLLEASLESIKISSKIVENAERIAPRTRQLRATGNSRNSKRLWLQFGASEVRFARRFPLFYYILEPTWNHLGTNFEPKKVPETLQNQLFFFLADGNARLRALWGAR